MELHRDGTHFERYVPTVIEVQASPLHKIARSNRDGEKVTALLSVIKINRELLNFRRSDL